MKHVLSIRALLITIIAVCMVPIFVTVLYESAVEGRAAVKAAQVDLIRRVELRAGGQEEMLEHVRQVLEAAAHRSVPLLDEPARCSAALLDLMVHFPDFAGMGLAASDGRTICTSGGIGNNVDMLADIQRAISADAFSVGNSTVGVIRSRPLVMFSFPFGVTGRKAVVYALLDDAAIQGRFARIQPAAGTTEFLMDSAGAALASSPAGGARPGKQLPDPIFRALAPELMPRQSYSLLRNGRMYAMQLVKPAGAGSLTIAASVSIETVLAPARDRLWRALARLTLATLLTSAIALLLADKLVGRPIVHVLQDLQAVERGHASVVRASPGEHWEVLELARIKGTVEHVAAKLAERARERDRIMTELEHSEQRYRTQFEAAPQPMWVYDAETLAFLLVNESAVAHYGYSRDEFMRMSLRDLRPAEDVPQFLEQIARNQVQTHTETSSRHMTKAGQIIHVELAAHDFDWSGRHARMVIAYDVTSRVNAAKAWKRLTQTLEAQVQRRTRDLEEANRELEAFSYSVSHDLRNPIAGIQAFCAALARRYGDSLPEEAAQYVERISIGAAQMNMLVADLLALSRVGRDTMDLKRVDVAELAGIVVEGLRERFPARDVSIAIDKTIPVWADRRLMIIVLENLIGNAWKFTARTQRAMIRVERHEVDRMVEGFAVTDNGAGFDSSRADMLFQPFQRLHSEREFEGTGIGLAIVQRIVRRLDGKVWAESSPGQGARFTVCLPAGSGKPADDDVSDVAII